MVVQYSQNKIFRIDTAKPHVLFVKSDVEVPSKWLKPIIDTRTPKGMVAYAPANILSPNDCLVFAESLAADIPGRSDTMCMFRERSTNLIFGHSYKQNIRIANTPSAILNEKADPEQNESYAIVRLADIEKEIPYHIGYVLFKDGSTTITMEADTGSPDLKYPVFDMYDTKDPKKSFHRRFKSLYTPAVTIVLKKR